MRKFLFILVALFSINTIAAKQVSENEATIIASKFFNTSKGQNLPKSSTTRVSLAHEFKSGNATLMYAFNNGYDSYVLVSGDDTVIPVLGYSDKGQFDYNTLPANARAWFDMYAQMIKSIREGKSNPIKTYSSATSVEPLIETKWNQDYPYWNLTPKVNRNPCYTGCPATAMAQIAYYHKWPVASSGEVDYVTESMGIPIKAELNTTFDWANMTPTYDQNSTETSCNAVAELMREIGYAMEMDYTDEGSGSTQRYIAKAIVNNLGYDKGLRIHYAGTHEEEDWVEMLKEELNEKRPILYCGYTPLQEGHAFVCDGYDTDGLFHINWGWGGISDGYFVITSLDPESQGLGGAESGAGFNTGQLAIMSIQKPVENSIVIPYTLLYENGIMDISETSIDITFEDLGNAGYGDFEGALCSKLISEKGTVVMEFVLVENLNCRVYEANKIPLSIPLEIFSTLEDGNYAFYLYTVDSNETEVEIETSINPFAFNKEGDVFTSLFQRQLDIILEHRNGSIEIIDDIAYFHADIINLTGIEEGEEEEDDEEGNDEDDELEATNEGEGDDEDESEGEETEDFVYNGQIAFLIYNSDDESAMSFASQEISIEPGQSIKLQFSFSVANLPDGEYYLEMHSEDGSEINPTKAPEFYFEINRDPVSINKVELDNSNRIVNVVAIDGRIIKQNVKASEASQDLAPGVYFIGNKKVFIK